MRAVDDFAVGDDRGDGLVVGSGGDVVEDLFGQCESDGLGVEVGPGEEAVVEASASAEAVAPPVIGQSGSDDEVDRGRVDLAEVAVRLPQAVGGVEEVLVVRRAEDGSHGAAVVAGSGGEDGLAGRPGCAGQGGAVDLAFDGQVQQDRPCALEDGQFAEPVAGRSAPAEQVVGGDSRQELPDVLAEMSFHPRIVPSGAR